MTQYFVTAFVLVMTIAVVLMTLLIQDQASLRPF